MSKNPFLYRHIGPNENDQRHMLKTLGMPSLETLITQTIPGNIRYNKALDVPEGVGEEEALAELHEKIEQNIETKPMIGQGYFGTHVPPVILRNLFENPGWYTSYTPYQPEISQGRLEMLFHFQTLISELTGLPIANASLLDEATAVAEAAGIAYRAKNGKRSGIVLANSLYPQSLDVLSTRGETIGFDLKHGADTIDETCSAVIVQYPDSFGEVQDFTTISEAAKAAGALFIVVADPMALLMSDAPATWGADIVVGAIQRYGVPLGNGGPHAAFMAVSEKHTRTIPGRLVGQSIDSDGNPAYRLALQTREQHIRREKATSNICTAQALLANMAAAYAIWHGPEGLIHIASKIHGRASRFAASLIAGGIPLKNAKFFDTVVAEVKGKADDIIKDAEQAGYLLHQIDADHVAIAFDETIGRKDIDTLCHIFGVKRLEERVEVQLTPRDTTHFMTQEIFHQCRSETDMMRMLRRMMDQDLALDKAMIPLGSCTMKLNAAAEMIPVSWSKVANMHPFAPSHHLKGYQIMIDDLDRWLSEITGFAKVSFQPNAGSQGEYAGLLAIKRYHEANGEGHRNICLIPSSAHGTNPASSQMAGYKVVVVKCTESGDVDLSDLDAKLEKHGNDLAALMITYPSTHGVFETAIKTICQKIHDHGGQVYLDGANMNAMVGLARPGDIGGDVCHLNLHKTFCIPHGGGGPGVGPIGVASHLVPHLPGHSINGTSHAVSAAPQGSASILPISWMYIRMLGSEGLKRASEVAILSANYIAKQLESHYNILYKGENGCVAHECIIDTRPYKDSAGVSVDDFAKRLIDYGFHAPTMSWPVAGTLMVEPTESEPLAEVDRFIHAMIAIADEAKRVEAGEWPLDDNPMVNAPHTAKALLADEWTKPYRRERAAYPDGINPAHKYWPPVARVDNVHGDRNLVCTCPPLEDYMEEEKTA